MQTRVASIDFPTFGCHDFLLNLRIHRLGCSRLTSLWAVIALVLRKVVVWVAVKPPLTRLSGRNDWVATFMGMFGRVPVWRVITARCSAALLTGTEMRPAASGLDAVFAHLSAGMFDRCDCTYVRAHAVERHDCVL